MQNHLDDCLTAPDNAKSKKQNDTSQSSTYNTTPNITPNITSNTTHMNTFANRPVKRTKITKTPRIENFIDRMTRNS